ncbi:hypothetical protein GF356_04485 [candidate division GN15 bacterium]|nr:hypothetical protein [candidate division GN15 bacterium]
MQTIEALRRQIDSAEDLHSVVKTMKALAAVSIHQFEEASESIRTYNRAVELGLQILVRSQAANFVDVRPHRDQPLGVVVFGSAQGMCGQFNEDLTEFVDGELISWAEAREELVLCVLGDKAAGLMSGHGYEVQQQLTVPSSVSAITAGVRDVLEVLDTWQQQQIMRVALCFNQRTGGATYEPHWLQILPLDMDWVRDLANRPWESRCLPTHRLSWQEAFAALVREHLFVSLFRAFAESLASENASRLAAMQGAESNIEDRLEELHDSYNHQRQNSITSELLDIASGYEALRKDESEDESDD